MERSFRESVVLSFIGRNISVAVQFVVVVVLARLLTPHEVGIYSVSAAFVGLAGLLRSMGVGQYVVQEKDLTNQKLQAAFAVSLGVALSMAVFLMIAAPYLGEFYGEKGVADVLRLLSVNFMLIPLGSISMAYLQRQMAFDKSLVIRVGSELSGAAVTLYCAFIGLSYMSMAWGGIAGTLVTVLLASYYRPKGLPWMPALKGMKKVLVFGFHVSAATVVGHLGSTAPDIVIGKVIGMAAVGVYSRAIGVITLLDKIVGESLQPVVFPHFAKAVRENRSLKNSFLKMMSLYSVVSVPFYLMMMVVAEPFVSIMFGSNWLEAAPLIRLLCVAGVVASLMPFTELVFIAAGEVKRYSRAKIIVGISVIVTVLVGAPFGIVAVAALNILNPLVRIVVLRDDVRRIIGCGFLEILATYWLSLLIGVLSVIPILLCELWVFSDQESDFMVLTFAGVTGLIVWAVSVWVTGHPMREEVVRNLGVINAKLRKSE